MPTPAASVTALVQPAAASTPAAAPATRATGTPGTGPFQDALNAVGQQQPPATVGTETVGIVGVDEPTLVDDTGTDTSETTDGTLAGLLAVAAQVLTSSANATVTQTTGGAPEQTDAAATRSRADQLRLDTAAGDAIPQLPAQPQTTAPAAEPVPAPVRAETPELPDPAATPAAVVAARTATTARVRGQVQTVPAQAPIVTNLLPTIPVPADPSVTNPPVVEPTPAVPVAGLPSTQLGERPANAGEQFAALASAGARLADRTAPPPSGAFANALGNAEAAPEPAPTVAVTIEPASGAAAPRVRFATGDTVLPPVNFSTQAMSDLGRAPVRSAEFAYAPERLPTDRTADEPPPTISVPNPLAAAPTRPTTFAVPSAPSEVAAPPVAQLADEMVKHAHVVNRDGGVEFRMRLDPPELGQVQVKLVTRGTEIHGEVLVASEAVRRMIESQLPELRQRLEDTGVSVQRFDVATDPNAGGGQGFYRQPGQEFAPRPPLEAAGAPPRGRAERAAPGTLDVTV